MKRILDKIGVSAIGIILILLIYTGVATAVVEIDCPSNTDRPTTNMAYAYGNWDASTYSMTYLIDVINSPGTELKEYCVYPNPGFTGSDSDLTVLYPGWSIDRPGNRPYFGFEDKNAPTMLFNGDTGIQMGKAIYSSGMPNSELILLHIINSTLCSPEGDPSCWRIPAGPLPTPSPTETPTPTPGDIEPPTTPLCPVAIVLGPTSINFSWLASTDNIGISGYNVYRSTDNTNFGLITFTTDLYYIDTGLTTGTTYYYYVEAVDTSGLRSAPSDVVYATPRDMNPPVVTVPPNMILEAISQSGATATFTVTATDDIDGPITVTCNPSSGSIFPIGYPVGYTTVTCIATDNSGNIGSAVFMVTVTDTTPPTAPTGLTTTSISYSRIDLSWTASTDIVGVYEYRIYRSYDNVDFSLIASVSGSMTTYSNTGLMPSTRYYYYVIAYDRAGNPSDNSNTGSETTPEYVPTTPTPAPTGEPTPVPTPTPSSTPSPGDYPPVITSTIPGVITVEATSSNGAVVDYSTYSFSAYDSEDGESKIVTCDPVSGSTFPLGTTVVSCTTTDSVGNVGMLTFIINVIDTTPPTDPTGLTATAISHSRIDLNWMASTDVVGIYRYIIYRSLDGINFGSIGTSIDTTFSNFGLIPNTTYYYYVMATDTSGNPSGNSNIAGATTLPQPPNPPGGGGTPTPTPGSTPTPAPTTNPCEPTSNTQTGQNVEVELTGSIINVYFSAVTECGDTASISYHSNQWGPLPSSYRAMKFYDMTTTAVYTNDITISIIYSPQSDINEQTLRMFHYENGDWTDVTTSLNTVEHTIMGRVTSLSPFALAGSGSGGGSGTVRTASSIDNIGFMILSISLITIGIVNLRRKR